jgi:molecular chaperone GrpE
MNPEEQKSEEIIENKENTENTDTTGMPEDPSAEKHWPEDEEVSDLTAKVKEEQEKYLRLYSEFENFRRRTSKERLELMQTAGKEVILTMLPVLDDFERALKAAGISEENKAAAEGFELIYKKMAGILEAMGLKAMESVGKPFDVEIHEAITKIQAGEDKKGMVVDEAEKGYLLNDKVIRFAKVIVGE